MSIDYSIDRGQLVIRQNPKGTVVWLSTFAVPVIQIIPLAGSEGCLALLDFAAKDRPLHFENLLRVTAIGTIQWTAQLPGSHDAFTQVAIRDGHIEAHTWNGYLAEIDPTSGKVVQQSYVK